MPRTETELMEGWEFYKEGTGDGQFHPVTLPHDWAIEAEFEKDMEEGVSQGFRNRYGTGWYRKELVLPQIKTGYRYLLSFGGIYENSTVWVNEREAGGRKYGYSSFTLDVTEFLQEGRNEIKIKVDNTQKPSDRWYSGSGIYRTVKLVEVENLHFDPWEVVVRTEITGSKARVTVRHGLWDGNPCAGTVRVQLLAADGSLAAASEGRDQELELTVEQARLWSAEDPYLYTLTLALLEGERIADQISLHIGSCTVEMIAQKGMFVNGKQVKLKGVCLHQDGGCLGIGTRKEIFRQRLLALKGAGCNAVRTAHHVYCSEFLDLCDELGFYVYEECFDKWHGGLYRRYFQTQWRIDVDAMVKRDRNRPCIILWGVGNEVENQGQSSMLRTLKLLTEYVRSLDDRPVSYAMNPHFKRESNVDLKQVKDIQQFVDEVSDTEIYDNTERMERIAGIAAYVDVISCNYQEQWYPLIHEKIPDKLILGTEVYQYFCGDEEQMQNFTDINPVLAVMDSDYCIGSFIWTGIDYLGESLGWPAKGWGGSLIRTNGSRRPGFYLMQSYWSKEPMARFFVLDYSMEDEGVKEHWDIPMWADHWHFPQFHKTVIPYAIMSNCEEVQLFLNGKRFYIPRPAECRNRMITGFLPYLPGVVEVIGMKDGREVCRDRIVTPGQAARLKFTGEAWTFRQGSDGEGLRLPAEKNYQVQLAVRAFDEEDNPCFREERKVRFRVEGPARILAVDAGRVMGEEPYQADSIHMFRGQASVMLALTGEPGEVRVYAEGVGEEPACMKILAG